MRDNYNNRCSYVKCEETGLYVSLGAPISGYRSYGSVTSIELIDEDYRPLQVKITTESGSVIRVFKFDTVIEQMKE